MADVKKTPHWFTAKAGPADVAVGNDVFVVEVREDSERSYWLGYKYWATEKFYVITPALISIIIDAHP